LARIDAGARRQGLQAVGLCSLLVVDQHAAFADDLLIVSGRYRGHAGRGIDLRDGAGVGPGRMQPGREGNGKDESREKNQDFRAAAHRPHAPDLQVMPPSTTSSIPVTYLDSSEARNSAALATSQASPIWPIGTCASRARHIASTSPLA